MSRELKELVAAFQAADRAAFEAWASYEHAIASRIEGAWKGPFAKYEAADLDRNNAAYELARFVADAA